MVRCADCGFFSLIRREDRSCVEAEERTREEAWRPSAVFDLFPVCFVGAISLRKEMDNDGAQEFLKVVRDTERPCDQFTPWIRGSSPKEHKQMLEAREMRAWQAEQKEADRQWQAEQKSREQRETRQFQVFITIFATFLALISAAIQRFALPSSPPPVINVIVPETKPPETRPQ